MEQLTSDSLAVKEIRQYLTTSAYAASEITYNTYGNVTITKGAPNSSNQREIVEVTYDTIVHTYPVKVDDVYGEFSLTTYDYAEREVLEPFLVNP